MPEAIDISSDEEEPAADSAERDGVQLDETDPSSPPRKWSDIDKPLVGLAVAGTSDSLLPSSAALRLWSQGCITTSSQVALSKDLAVTGIVGMALLLAQQPRGIAIN